MSFPRFLRNADSGAGGGSSSAPSSSAPPAASGGNLGGGAAPSGDGGGSPSGSGAPAPAGGSSTPQPQGNAPEGKITLPNRFAPEWEAEFMKLSESDKQAYWNNDPKFVEAGAEPPVDPNGQQQAQAPVSIAADDPITPEIMESLPANVKATLEEFSKFEERVAPFEKFLTPEFQQDLQYIMEDPVVQSRIQAMKDGADSADSWFEESVDMDSIVKGLEDKFKLSSMDFSLDPTGSMETFKKCMMEVGALVAKNTMIHGEIKAREAKEVARRETLKNQVYFDLAQSVEALKSSEPIGSESHPIHGFRKEIEESLNNGEISWKYFEKNGKALFASYAARNGMLQTPQKQYANIRSRIVKSLDGAARNAAVTSTTMNSGSMQGSQTLRHGINAESFLASSDADQSKYIMEAINRKNGGDPSMLRDIQYLQLNGKWPS